VKYRSGRSGCLTWARDPGQGQCMAGSLTGAVASQNVTEAPKGSLNLDGNQVSSASAQGSLTARPTRQAGTLVPVESTVKYHSGRSGCLTWVRYPDQGQCLVGSLTGAVAS